MIKFFTTSWCTHCNNLKKSLSASDLDGIVFVDADKEPNEVAKYGVKTVPTLIKVYGDSETDRISGSISRKQYLDFVNA